MSRCQECGFKNAEGKKNCEKCGSKLYDLSSVNFNPDVVRTNLPQEGFKTIKAINDKDAEEQKNVNPPFMNVSHHTQPLSSLNFDTDETTSKKFTLVNERTGEKSTFDAIEKLNRENLAPENLTISSQKHLVISFENNQWHIQDESTNGATFIQVKNKMRIEKGMRIIIGNQIFRFEE